MSKKENPLISVIIPVYNVENYLKRCVDSVLNQTYKNIEIILVNDGSQDNSLKICEEYKKSHKNIKVINKSNGGLSSARNMGIAFAKGDYIGFVDSDDWIESDMYTVLHNLIQKEKADIAQCRLTLASSEDKKIKNNNSITLTLEGRDEILEYYLKSSTKNSEVYSVCLCLFPTSIVKNFKFREGKINEDIDWKYKVLSTCHKMVISSQKCYYYFQANNSISSGILKKRDFELYEAADALVELTKQEKNSKIRFYGYIKKARTPFSLLCRIAYYGIDDSVGNKKDIIKDLSQQHRNYLSLLLKAPLPVSRKILAIAFAINYNLVALPLQLLHKSILYK